MPSNVSPRRFPPPWKIEEANAACFIVRDSTGQALGYFYFEDEPGRRSADVRCKAGDSEDRLFCRACASSRFYTAKTHRVIFRQ
ncbi:MAG: hypothetical protein ACLPTZ_00385 [Beijerinckiaceae bacterium]